MVSDLDASTVRHITDERRQASLDDYITRLSTEQREQIQAVAMDMWEPYIRADYLTNPDQKIVFDRYHVMGCLNTAVDTVRKREHRALAATGNNLLAGSK